MSGRGGVTEEHGPQRLGKKKKKPAWIPRTWEVKTEKGNGGSAVRATGVAILNCLKKSRVASYNFKWKKDPSHGGTRKYWGQKVKGNHEGIEGTTDHETDIAKRGEMQGGGNKGEKNERGGMPL